MVKDLRTGTEVSSIQEAMDGSIDLFIHSWLKAGCPTEQKTLNKESRTYVLVCFKLFLVRILEF
jgi:hypothetical protein